MSMDPRYALLLGVLAQVLAAGALAQSQPAPAETLAGRWTGTIGVDGRSQPVCIDFYRSASAWSALAGRADDPESFWPVARLQYAHPRISFALNDGPTPLTFDGARAGDSIRATATVEGAELALVLKRTGDAPRQPFVEEPVRLVNGAVTLEGLLLRPNENGPHPAVVLIHGTGRQSREEGRFFAQLFARRGIAALLYDKRDVGHDPSGMDLVDLKDLAQDALAGVELLRQRADIRPDRVGLWGISQGGWVAAIAAAQSKHVAFVAAIAAPGVTYAEVNLFAVANRLRVRGYSETEIERVANDLRRLDSFVRGGEDRGPVAAMLSAARRQPWFAYSTLPEQLPSERELQTWLRWRNLDLDPSDYWRTVQVPVLLLYGERDDVVPVARSVERITAALGQSGNKRLTVKVFPGAAHQVTLSQTDRARRGSDFAPGFLDTLTTWISAQTAQPAKSP